MSRPRLRPVLTALEHRRDDGTTELRSPAVGLWRGAPALHAFIGAETPLGQLEVLGVLHDLVAPADAAGFVVEVDAVDARVPVGYGTPLVVLDARQLEIERAVASHAVAGQSADAGLVFRAPSSGRYYSRPDPESPPFVNVGDTVTAGQTICLLEVMKTFNRVNYGGPNLPPSARVTAIRPQNGDDLNDGDVILELE